MFYILFKFYPNPLKTLHSSSLFQDSFRCLLDYFFEALFDLFRIFLDLVEAFWDYLGLHCSFSTFFSDLFETFKFRLGKTCPNSFKALRDFFFMNFSDEGVTGTPVWYLKQGFGSWRSLRSSCPSAMIYDYNVYFKKLLYLSLIYAAPLTWLIYSNEI